MVRNVVGSLVLAAVALSGCTSSPGDAQGTGASATVGSAR